MVTFFYNPSEKNKKALLSEFVVRQELYEEIMKDLEKSSMRHPEQHYLLVGQRGMGKTTLLLRLKYGIEDSSILNGKLLPIAFTEEQYQISELANLWEYVAEYLEDYHGFVDLYSEMERLSQDKDFEEKAFEILDAALKKTGKHIVLLIDNIGELFNKLEINEMRRFREILQTRERVRVIGGATSYPDQVTDHHEPFYDFFKMMVLNGLSKDEVNRLILGLGELNGEKEKIEQLIQHAPGRIETLRILTGGVPRTIALLFGIFLDYQQEHALKDLYKLLDLVTPLYKHRMDDLPLQQQKIVDAVARNWEPIMVKELAVRTRMLSKTLSAQLNQLEREQIVVKHDTATKNKTYMIRERFWNIWYLMRYGRRDDKEKVIWLVRFLESWLSADDLRERVESFVDKVEKASISGDQLELFSKVYAAVKNLPASSKLKLKSIEGKTKAKIVMSDDEWYACAEEEFKKGHYTNSLKCYFNIRDHSSAMAVFVLRFSEAECYESLFEVLDVPANYQVWERYFWAYIVVGIFNRSLLTKNELKKHPDEHFDFFKRSIALIAFYSLRPDMSERQLSLAILTSISFIRGLISIGLYNAVLKIMEEPATFVDGDYIFKDRWKPVYLAVKYLHQPDELARQPYEIASEALVISRQLAKRKK